MTLEIIALIALWNMLGIGLAITVGSASFIVQILKGV